MKCIECKHVKSTDMKMARQGFAACALNMKPGHYGSITYERDCQKFSRDEPEIIQKRVTWLERQ